MCCTRVAENTGRKKVAKNRHLSTIAQLCRAISLQARHLSTIGKNLLSSNMSSRCPHNMVNFGSLTAEIGSGVWGTPANLKGFASWQRYCMAVKYSERQPNFAALNRGRHLYSAGRPSRWALAHILVTLLCSMVTCNCCVHVQMCSNNSRLLSDQTLSFIKSHPLMDRAIPAFGGQPLLVLPSLQYVQ